ncbi:MAG: patatin-like phospholipase family protein, partial [Bacteroidota bacterium]
MNETLAKSLAKKEKTKILSLDGGGLRGILTLAILEKLEEEIKAQYGKGTRICDYFDIIGGTSTGSIIASALAIGKSVNEITDLYQKLGVKIF